MIPWNLYQETPCVCGHEAADHFFDRTIGCTLCNCKKFHPTPGLRVVKKDWLGYNEDTDEDLQ